MKIMVDQLFIASNLSVFLNFGPITKKTYVIIAILNFVFGYFQNKVLVLCRFHGEEFDNIYKISVTNDTVCLSLVTKCNKYLYLLKSVCIALT